MRLSAALGLDHHRAVALVGAGGKTTSLYLLGRELAALGKGVVLGTTTRIYPPPPEIPLVLWKEGAPVRQAAAAIKGSGQVFLTSGLEGGKVRGLSCSQLEALAALPQAEALVIEADGARGLSLKFPAAHEPVVCSQETLVVPVLGLSALGQKLGEGTVHRWQLVCRHLGVPPGQIITVPLAAAILCHPLSYGRFLRKNPLIPLLNQADTPEREELARELAELLLEKRGIEGVVVAAVETKRPVRALYRG